MNIVQLEYMLLESMKEFLGECTVERKYGDTAYTFPLDNGKQRAKLTVSIVDMTFCTVCKEEIVNPDYRQTVHKDCVSP